MTVAMATERSRKSAFLDIIDQIFFKVKKYKKTIFFNFKKNLIDRISLNSIILSIKSVVLIVKKFTGGN